jgi:hypothetical protein
MVHGESDRTVPTRTAPGGAQKIGLIAVSTKNSKLDNPVPLSQGAPPVNPNPTAAMNRNIFYIIGVVVVIVVVLKVLGLF